jgi:hypothetical protein
MLAHALAHGAMLGLSLLRYLYNYLFLREKNGAATKIRTRDPLITNQTTFAQIRPETLI